MNQLLWVNVAERRILGTAAVDNPRGVAFDAQGQLLVFSGRRLLRYQIGRDPLAPAPPLVIVDGLEDPQGLTLDTHGNIYVSDWGNSHQVKVFAPDGKLLRNIGQAGAPCAGLYNPDHLNHPQGITIDSQEPALDCGGGFPAQARQCLDLGG